MERRKERRLAGCGSSPVSSPTHRKLGLKGVLLRVWCTTCCGRNAKCAQRDVAQHALSTHPSGQGSQWPWAARPLWVPAGQGLGVTVPAGQKCPEREADQICQSHSKPHSLHPEGPQPKPSPWRAQGTAGGLRTCSFPPPQNPAQGSPWGYLQGTGHQSGLPVSPASHWG